MSALATRLLTEDEFLATLAEPMKNITGKEWDVLDIGPYVDAVAPADLQGHSIDDGSVEDVYRAPDDRFDHVLATTKTKNVYLAILVDLKQDAIYGHHLLDLNRIYGIMPKADP